jgi:hypothetical protein
MSGLDSSISAAPGVCRLGRGLLSQYAKELFVTLWSHPAMSSKFRSRIRKNAGLPGFARILANAAWKLFLDGYYAVGGRMTGVFQRTFPLR